MMLTSGKIAASLSQRIFLEQLIGESVKADSGILRPQAHRPSDYVEFLLLADSHARQALAERRIHDFLLALPSRFQFAPQCLRDIGIKRHSRPHQSIIPTAID